MVNVGKIYHDHGWYRINMSPPVFFQMLKALSRFRNNQQKIAPANGHPWEAEHLQTATNRDQVIQPPWPLKIPNRWRSLNSPLSSGDVTFNHPKMVIKKARQGVDSIQGLQLNSVFCSRLSHHTLQDHNTSHHGKRKHYPSKVHWDRLGVSSLEANPEQTSPEEKNTCNQFEGTLDPMFHTSGTESRIVWWDDIRPTLPQLYPKQSFWVKTNTVKVRIANLQSIT